MKFRRYLASGNWPKLLGQVSVGGQILESRAALSDICQLRGFARQFLGHFTDPIATGYVGGLKASRTTRTSAC
jgi:hypothetical protein